MAEARTLFGFAAEVGESLALERLCLCRALDAVPAGFRGRLFLNVHTQSLHDAEAFFAEIRALAEGAGVAPSDVVLEFSERNLVADQDALQRKLELCRAAGLLIAVDDVGAGHHQPALPLPGAPRFHQGRRLAHPGHRVQPHQADDDRDPGPAGPEGRRQAAGRGCGNGNGIQLPGQHGRLRRAGPPVRPARGGPGNAPGGGAQQDRRARHRKRRV